MVSIMVIFVSVRNRPAERYCSLLRENDLTGYPFSSGFHKRRFGALPPKVLLNSPVIFNLKQLIIHQYWSETALTWCKNECWSLKIRYNISDMAFKCRVTGCNSKPNLYNPYEDEQLNKWKEALGYPAFIIHTRFVGY